MTKEEFFNLPTNKDTVKKLYSESLKRFNNGNINTNWFFNEVAGSLKQYLGYRKATKAITTMPTTQSSYNDYVRIKGYGYRKELILPF